jgi:hypothetical protein
MGAVLAYFTGCIYYNYFIVHDIPFTVGDIAIAGFFGGYWIKMVKDIPIR